jgi:hypothetical protein
MQPHTLIIPDDNVYQQLVQLAAAGGFHIGENGLVSKAERTKRSREELLAIIRRGGDGQSIPDPLAWQREHRDDSDLPFQVLGH